MPRKKPIEDLPSNSLASRVAPIRESNQVEETRDAPEYKHPSRRAIRGQVIQSKKTVTRSIAEAFVGNGVGGYILQDVLVPALKNLISDAVTSGIEMILYGETKGRSRGRDRDRSVINYSGFSRRDRDDDRRDRRRVASYSDKFNLNEIYFAKHGDAEDVLDEMGDRCEEYGSVSVADFFELSGIEGATHAHYKYGWETMKKAFCTHTRHGWAIVFPDPEPLD